MSQLVINNLDFCKQSQFYQDQEIQGGIFSMNFEFDGAFELNPTGKAAAASGAAVGLAIGEGNTETEILTISPTE